MVTETEVLVVGGGLVGLAASAFLAQHGTGVVVAERHASTARHPKARLVNVPSIQRQNRWLAGYAGLGGDGAALVRPDGVVAARP